MSAIRFLAADALTPWLAGVAEAFRVLAPRREGRVVVFRPWNADGKEGEPSLTFERATASPKEALFPSCEVLMRFSATKDADDPAKLHMQVDDSVTAEPTVLFGGRPCDARGFVALGRAFTGGRFRDVYYAARKEATLIVTRTCDTPQSTCFCSWTGGGPASPEGSDVLMTAVADGFIFEGVSERGAVFLAQAPFPADAEASAATRLESMYSMRAKAEDGISPAPQLSAAAQRLLSRFMDTEFWQAETDKCLSCAACTYLCPTCQCFNITDEGDSLQGRRLRTWDNCMSPLFTREASGHNPRAAKAARMRNRVSHKFWYAVEYCGGAFSCTGCGRCIMHCPVSLDIREIVLKAIAE